jgi:hypothetical protein
VENSEVFSGALVVVTGFASPFPLPLPHSLARRSSSGREPSLAVSGINNQQFWALVEAQLDGQWTGSWGFRYCVPSFGGTEVLGGTMHIVQSCAKLCCAVASLVALLGPLF